jgi:hypothetical protein
MRTASGRVRTKPRMTGVSAGHPGFTENMDQEVTTPTAVPQRTASGSGAAASFFVTER